MDLVELEKIRRLKYRYLRCVDLKLWDEIEDVFTADATADYGTPSAGRPLKLASRDEIVKFLRDSLGNGIITLHAAGQPEIEIDGETATGTWRFEARGGSRTSGTSGSTRPRCRWTTCRAGSSPPTAGRPDRCRRYRPQPRRAQRSR